MLRTIYIDYVVSDRIEEQLDILAKDFESGDNSYQDIIKFKKLNVSDVKTTDGETIRRLKIQYDDSAIAGRSGRNRINPRWKPGCTDEMKTLGYIREIKEKYGANFAAEFAGISRPTLYRRLKDYEGFPDNTYFSTAKYEVEQRKRAAEEQERKERELHKTDTSKGQQLNM